MAKAKRSTAGLSYHILPGQRHASNALSTPEKQDIGSDRFGGRRQCPLLASRKASDPSGRYPISRAREIRAAAPVSFETTSGAQPTLACRLTVGGLEPSRVPMAHRVLLALQRQFLNQVDGDTPSQPRSIAQRLPRRPCIEESGPASVQSPQNPPT